MAINNKTFRLLSASAVAAGCLAIGAALVGLQTAEAQQPAPPPPEQTVAGQRGPMPRMMDHACADLDARRAGMLAFAEVRLGITDMQKAAWAKFSEAARTAEEPMKRACATLTGAPEPKTLPEHLQRMELMTQAHLATLQQLEPALTELYNALTPDQKQVADRLPIGFAPPPGGHMLMEHHMPPRP